MKDLARGLNGGESRSLLCLTTGLSIPQSPNDNLGDSFFRAADDMGVGNVLALERGGAKVEEALRYTK
jgi:hypothetical protein